MADVIAEGVTCIRLCVFDNTEIQCTCPIKCITRTNTKSLVLFCVFVSILVIPKIGCIYT